MEHDAELFECDSCPVLAQLQELDPVNAEAWRIYRELASRFAAELHMGGVALDRMTQGWDEERFTDLWRRLTVAFDVLNPAPERKE